MRTKYIIRWTLLVVVLGAVAWELRRGVLAYRAERTTFYPPRGAVAMPPDSSSLGLTRVKFSSRDRTSLSGWYIQSRDSSAILLAHGSDANRSSLIDEARILAQAGHGVLVFDFPGHGESAGQVNFGRSATLAVEGAIDFLATRPDVDSTRIGALGFSDGGVAVADAAATDERIRAVALVATPGDAERQTRDEYRRLGPIAVYGAMLPYRLRGVHLDSMRAIADVAAISPRPLAIFGGEEDQVVPEDEAKALFAASRAPHQLFIVAHGNHGEYAERDTAYAREVQGFFAAGLTRGATANLRIIRR
ncbi:MAG TPA: alpha/beta fold hydrolase [Gemmatimonadaceae bacterium]